MVHAQYLCSSMLKGYRAVEKAFLTRTLRVSCVKFILQSFIPCSKQIWQSPLYVYLCKVCDMFNMCEYGAQGIESRIEPMVYNFIKMSQFKLKIRTIYTINIKGWPINTMYVSIEQCVSYIAYRLSIWLPPQSFLIYQQSY